jgi:hypothetical protein
VRLPADSYATPAWVVEALLRAESFPDPIWEAAPGSGHYCVGPCRHRFTGLRERQPLARLFVGRYLRRRFKRRMRSRSAASGVRAVPPGVAAIVAMTLDDTSSIPARMART